MRPAVAPAADAVAMAEGGREYPAAPLVGVGAVVIDAGRVLLVQRGRAPSAGRWSLPGGLVELGEPLEVAVRREVAEECGLVVRVHGLVGTVDRIVRDAAGRVRYHYVLLDYLASPAGGRLQAGSDALAARWCGPGELASLELTDGLVSMVRRALALNAERPTREGAR
jgi:8-oxo-dGTP diphosphatase